MMKTDINHQVKIDFNDGLIVMEPNDVFQTWVKSAATQCGIDQKLIEHELTLDMLRQHALVIVAPILTTTIEEDDFISQHKDILFSAMIATWIFPAHDWPTNRDEATLKKLFTINYFNAIPDVFNLTDKDADKAWSLFMLRPKTPAVEWIKRLYAQHKIAIPHECILDEDVFRKIGVLCTIAPIFASDRERALFIQQNYMQLFEYALSKYCDDDALWIEDRSYNTFLDWFDYSNYYPILSNDVWSRSPSDITQYIK